VTASPTNDTIDEYIKELKKRGINIVIKLNEKDMYDTGKFKQNDIEFIHMEIEDGNIPDEENILKLIEIGNEYDSICIHCTAGLGRAPLVMSLLWILQFNQDPHDTAMEIRKLVPNCLNKFQLQFLTEFKRKKYIKKKSCILM
jgi:protein tyrosine phosphatase type 4A